jgi:hypothetical protein
VLWFTPGYGELGHRESGESLAHPLAVMMPEIHASHDADDRAASVTALMWYHHYYGRGHIAEMVTCWENPPVRIGDIAYCGVAARCGPVITELEKELPESCGPAGSA